MTDRKLVFRKSDAEGTPAGEDPGTPEAPRESIVSRIADALKGTVTVKPGTDLTEPVDVEWNAAR